MKVVKVTGNHMSELTALFECVIKDLRNEGVYQWDSQYPSIDNLRSDIEEGCLYGIIEESILIGTIVINEQQESLYSTLNWDDFNGKSLCIHRLVVRPKNQGKGIGKTLLQFAEIMAVDNGYSSIRLDAYSGNSVALNFYERSGYRRTGEVFFPRREMPFICYEKVLK